MRPPVSQAQALPRSDFRPAVESLDERVMPALLSLSLPVSAAVAVHVGSVACATPAIGADVCVRVGVTAQTCAPTPSPWCGTPSYGCSPVGGLLNLRAGLGLSLGGVVNRVGCLVPQVVGQASLDIGAAARLADCIISPVNCAPVTC
jgi:hypothetical protein